VRDGDVNARREPCLAERDGRKESGCLPGAAEALCPECARRMSIKEARRRAVEAEVQQQAKDAEMNVAAWRAGSG
jgi:hypothetical protein